MWTRTADLWLAAGRAARDGRKRLVALLGLLATLPVLLLGSLVSQALGGGGASFLDGIGRPLAYVLAPLRRAWETDQDVALLGYLAWQGLLLTLLWAWFGGLLHRLAAVSLTRAEREPGRAVVAFARRHWRALAGARVALWTGFALPLVAVGLLALLGRLPGPLGGVLLAVAVAAAGALALLGVVLGSVGAAAGFLTGPAIAVEASDTFDALSRTFTYGSAGLARLAGWRLLFFLGVALGSGWRLLRAALAVSLGLLAVLLGAGEGALDGARAILGAGGVPEDAARLGLTFADYLLAAVMALVLLGFLLLWLADLVSRATCARCAVYLLLREAVDRVPVRELRAAAQPARALGPEAAGFEEVARLG